MSKKTSNIQLTVALDENKVPEKLFWTAEDGGIFNEETKSFFLSVWDHRNKESLSIDLWTKEMPVDEMKVFFYQMFATMAEKFYQATDDQKMRDTILDFCEYFAEKMEIKKGK